MWDATDDHPNMAGEGYDIDGRGDFRALAVEAREREPSSDYRAINVSS
jgi:hypothetical protein